jgi:hypothetical protein
LLIKSIASAPVIPNSLLTALAEVVQETNQQLKETSQLTGLTGDSLTDFTGKVRTTAKVFDQEYKEVLKASNIVAKEFGITGAEAIDLINNGFVQGTNINDDYLQQLSEYSTQFKAAGLSAQDLNNVIALGAKEGIFDDKAADTVKEGGLRLREFTKATSDALVPLGKLRNEQIKQAIESGNSFEAIQLVSKGLKEVELTAGQTQGIITGVFGGAGEDAGIRFLERLSTIKTGQDAVNDSLTEQQKKQLEILKVEEQLANAEVRLGDAFKNSGKEIGLFFTQLQTLGLEGLLSVIDDVKEGFAELVEPFNEAKTELNELSETFGLTGGGVLDFIKKFNPLTFLFDQFVFTVKVVIAFVGELLSALNTGIDIVKDFTNNIIEFATSFEVVNTTIARLTVVFNDFLALFTDAPKFFKGFLAATNETFNQFSKITKQSLTGTKDLILSLFTFNPAKVKEAFSKSIPVIEGSGEAIALAFKKGFDSVDVITVDPKKIEETKIVEKAIPKEKAAKTTDALKKDEEAKKKAKDLEDKALQERLSAIDKAAAEEKLLATERINQGLITEQEYQDELLLIELRRLETLQDAQEQAGKDTIATEQQIQDILLKDKQAGIKLGEEQEKEAAKQSLKIKKAEEKAKLEAEKEATEARKERANDPLAQAGFDALEGKIKNELVLAGVQAFRASLENGEDVQTALQNGTKAVAAGQLFKSLSGFHDGGYTGDGNEYEVAGVAHKGEMYQTAKQTSKYNMKGWSANDFDSAIDTGYFRQFEDTNNQLSEQMTVNKQVVVNNNNEVLVKAINDLPKKMPQTDMSFYGKDLQQRTKTGSTTKTTTFRGVR